MQTTPIDRWKFALTDERGASGKGYDDSAWRAVTVPHDWSVEQPFAVEHSSGTGYLPGGIGWYRAHVDLAPLELRDGQHVRLAFHGVYKNADVWVNGYHLGGRPSGYAPFSFDLTEILGYAPDDDLVISVRVDHTDISDSRWYNGSGITRAVEIEVHSAVRLREHGTAFATVSADADAATVTVQHSLVSSATEAVTVRALNELRSLTSGRTHTFETTGELAAGGSDHLVVTTQVPQPDLWSDTSPSLYRLTSTLVWSEGGEERAAVYAETVGIRTFRFDPDAGFSINGETRKLRGVCLHEDAGALGVAVPAEVWLRRLLALQDMGCNAVRMAHNPHSPDLYALCDALGFFVIDEAFDEWENPKNKWWHGHNVYPPRHEGAAEHFPEWHERDLAAMVLSHRNHASIIAWSIGNEVDYPNDPYASPLFDEMTGNNDANKPAAERLYDPDRPDIRRLTTISNRLVDIVHDLDPTRPATLAAAFPELSSRTGLLDRLDLIGYNYKEHLYADDHIRFPDHPFIGSENSHRYADWLQVEQNDYVAGQFLWTGIDYLGEAHGWPIHGSGAGLLTVAGFPKEQWHLRRSWWSDAPVARLVVRAETGAADRKTFWSHPVSRRWDAARGDLLEVLCFAGGDEQRLTVDDVAVPLARDEETGCWTATVSAHATHLVLETLVGGRVVARDELRPPRAAARIDAVVWRAPEAASARCDAAAIDRGDVIQIECTLLDDSGAVAGSDAVVSVEVDGGELRGIENGDLADNAPYSSTSRRTLDGRLIVFVRTPPSSDETRQSTTVTLTATGLPVVRVEVPR
ncbi:MAG TPA: glycoside hydrolase family 2 TIM barrel-domain containing protein [Agromyces sp.]